jgi:hypothetical protein
MLPSESFHGEPFPYPLDRNRGPCRDANASGNSSSARNRTVPRRKREACCYQYCWCLARHFDSVRIGNYLHCARFGVPLEYYSSLVLVLLYSGTEEIESIGDNYSGCRNDGTGAKRRTTSRWSSKWRHHEALEELVHYRRRHRRHSRRPGQGAKCAS